MTLKDLFNEKGSENSGINDSRHQPSQPRLTSGTNPEEIEEEDETTNLGRNDNEEEEDEITPTRDERFLDRMIKVRGMPKSKIGDKSPGFLMDPDFAEQYVLNSFDAKEQRHLWRRLMDIIHLAQGDGNEELVKSKSMSFGFRVLSHRARNDTLLEMNERLAWLENRQTNKQIVKTSQVSGSSGKVGGFLSRLFGK